MLKTCKFRIYPTITQSVLIKKHVGSSRFIYNLALETKLTAYSGAKVNLSCFDLIKQIPDLKKEFSWLNECNSQSLQYPIRNLDNAFTRFFKGQTDFPKYKRKTDYGNFTVPQHIKITNKRIYMPKFKEGIKIVDHREIKGDIKRVTISFTSTNKFFASILYDTKIEPPKKKLISEPESIGIDLGITDFIVSSNGDIFNNPKFFRKSESKLKYAQRKCSIHKGKKSKLKVALLREKVANQRKDFINKVSSELISKNHTVCVETLSITNMLKNKYLSKSISDAGWGMLVSMLEYKSEWNGNNLIKIGRFEPSSKTCSDCGYIYKDLKLKERTWICSKCNVTQNRDLNAAINIKKFALRNYISKEIRYKNQNELPTLVGVTTSGVRK